MNVTKNQVQRVMRASVWGRRISTALIGMTVASLVVVLFVLITGKPLTNFKFSISAYVFTQDSLTRLPVKVWIVSFFLIATTLGIGWLYLLRTVFANLARGEIFCEANVRHIRNMGLLIIAGGLLVWIAPLANATIFMFAGHDGIESRATPFIQDGLGSFAYGGLLIFLSWIMAVGLGVREDAEKLRHDAELVI